MNAPPSIIFEPLSATHNVKAFTCSIPEFAEYLQRYALKNQLSGYGRTTVAVDQATGDVLGYYSLCATSIDVSSLSPSVTKGFPRYPIPGVLLTKMARSQTHDGVKLGTKLLIDAMRTAHLVGAQIGWRFMVVDAYNNEVVPFYTKFGFTPLSTESLRLFMNAADVEGAVSGLAQ